MAYFGVTFASTSLAGDPYLNFALVIFIELLHVPFEVSLFIGKICLEHKGPSIKYVRKIFGIFDPLPPLVRILARLVVLNSRSLPYYIMYAFGPTPPSPSGRTYLIDAPLLLYPT